VWFNWKLELMHAQKMQLEKGQHQHMSSPITVILTVLQLGQIAVVCMICRGEVIRGPQKSHPKVTFKNDRRSRLPLAGGNF
jgi:hypothetical protein